MYSTRKIYTFKYVLLYRVLFRKSCHYVGETTPRGPQLLPLFQILLRNTTTNDRKRDLDGYVRPSGQTTEELGASYNENAWLRGRCIMNRHLLTVRCVHRIVDRYTKKNSK